MTFWNPWLGTQREDRKKKWTAKTTAKNRLGIEALEPRITPADVSVASLLFRGDLIENNGVFSAAATPIEVGYNPTMGEAFRPLITLSGNTLIDPGTNQVQFQGTGSFLGQTGLLEFWNSSSLTALDVQYLTGTGQTITGKSFSLGDLVTTATTLTLLNPDGGDTSDSTIRLNGTGTLTFGAENNGTKSGNPLSVNSLQWTINGPGAAVATGKVTGPFYAAATTWNLQTADYNSVVVAGVGTTHITGPAGTTIRNETQTAELNGQGLSIINGAFTGLDAKLNGAMTFAGCAGTVSGAVTWVNDTLKFSGGGSVNFNIAPGVDELFQYSNLTFTVSQNALVALDAETTQGMHLLFVLKGINVVSLELTTQMAFDADPQKENLN